MYPQPKKRKALTAAEQERFIEVLGREENQPVTQRVEHFLQETLFCSEFEKELTHVFRTEVVQSRCYFFDGIFAHIEVESGEGYVDFTKERRNLCVQHAALHAARRFHPIRHHSYVVPCGQRVQHQGGRVALGMVLPCATA